MIEWILFFGLPLVPFLVTNLNLLTWGRGVAEKGAPRDVAVLIPARNEEANITAAVRSVLGQDPHRLGQVTSVLVYDDNSTDRTAELVEKLAEEDVRVRLIRGGPLPPGWIGKPHACQRLFEASQAEFLLFLDADVRLKPTGLPVLGHFAKKGRADVVSAVPQQEMGSFFERLILPLLHLTYMAWLPLFLVGYGRSPSTVAANGQILFLPRKVLSDLGGFAPVRHEVVDDVAFVRLAKQAGYRVKFSDGFSVATCRMYRGPSHVWAGFSKNLFEGLGGSVVSWAVAIGLYLGAFVVPYVVFFAYFAQGVVHLPSLLGVGVNLVLRFFLALRFRHPLSGVLLHPIAVLALVSIATNSLLWVRKNQIRWAGRSYQSRAVRKKLGLTPVSASPPGWQDVELPPSLPSRGKNS